MKTVDQASAELMNLQNDLDKLIRSRFEIENSLIQETIKKINDLKRLYFMSSPFALGQTYLTMSGELVTMMGVSNQGTIYESMYDQFECHRYTTRDFGRVTGTKSEDYGDNIDLRCVPMYGYIMPIWWNEGFLAEKLAA
jgi:hypothetical protein